MHKGNMFFGQSDPSATFAVILVAALTFVCLIHTHDPTLASLEGRQAGKQEKLPTRAQKKSSVACSDKICWMHSHDKMEEF